MAHLATVTVWARRESGRRILDVTVVEADVGTASVWSLKAEADNIVRFNGTQLATGARLYVPRRGRILDYSAQKVSGAGATIAPGLFKVQVPTSKLEELLLCDAETSHHLLDELPYDFGAAPPTLHGKSAPASGSNNVVHTRFTLVEGL